MRNGSPTNELKSAISENEAISSSQTLQKMVRDIEE